MSKMKEHDVLEWLEARDYYAEQDAYGWRILGACGFAVTGDYPKRVTAARRAMASIQSVRPGDEKLPRWFFPHKPVS